MKTIDIDKSLFIFIILELKELFIYLLFDLQK